MRFCAVWHDTVWHAASAAWQFGPSLVDFLVQGSTLVFNTKALLPASGLCLPIQWSCTGKLQDFQETLLFDTTALIKILSFFPTTALIWSTALIRYPRVCFGWIIRRTPRVPHAMPIQASYGPRTGIFNVFHIPRSPYVTHKDAIRRPNGHVRELTQP